MIGFPRTGLVLGFALTCGLGVHSASWAAAGGPYEPNDIMDEATNYYVDAGSCSARGESSAGKSDADGGLRCASDAIVELQQHSFYDENDVDWVVFYAEASMGYTIKVPPLLGEDNSDGTGGVLLDPLADPVLELYDAAGALLISRDNFAKGEGEYIDWTAPGEGFYFVRVSHYVDATQPLPENAVYHIKIFRPIAPQSGYLVGNLTRSCDGTPLSGVQILAKDAGQVLVDDTISFPNGDFNLPLQIGSYTITASKSGYTSQSSSVTINENQTSTLNFGLTPTGGCVASLAAPTGLSASDGARTDRVLLNWSGVSGASSYQIFRCTGSSCVPTAVTATATSTSHEDTAITAGTTYSYRLKACAGADCSEYSNINTGYAEVVVTPPPTPAIPGNPSASDGTYADHVDVTWSASTNTTLYYPYRCTSASTSSCIQRSATTSTRLLDYVAAGSSFHYTVKACNDTSCSDYSAFDQGSTASLSPPSSAPSGLTASDGAYTDRVVLSWTTVTEATSYRPYRCTTSDTASCSQLTEVSATSYTDYPPAVSQAYSYRVKACNSGGCSDFSPDDTGFADACAEQTLQLANTTLSGTQGFCAKGSITLGPNLQVSATANITLTAPVITFTPLVTIPQGATLHAGQ